MLDPTGMFGLGGALMGSTIGSVLNQMTGFAGEIVLESLRAKRFAWANMKRILKVDELKVWYLDDAGIPQFFGTF